MFELGTHPWNGGKLGERGRDEGKERGFGVSRSFGIAPHLGQVPHTLRGARTQLLNPIFLWIKIPKKHKAKRTHQPDQKPSRTNHEILTFLGYSAETHGHSCLCGPGVTGTNPVLSWLLPPQLCQAKIREQRWKRGNSPMKEPGFGNSGI